jgi:uncharacterized membrane protein
VRHEFIEPVCHLTTLSHQATMNPMTDLQTSNNRNFVLVTYVLFAIGVFTGGIFTLVGVIMAYVKRADCAGTYLETHTQWLISTFWWGMLWYVLSGLTVFIGIGFVGFFITSLWYLYRIIKGIVRFADSRAVV